MNDKLKVAEIAVGAVGGDDALSPAELAKRAALGKRLRRYCLAFSFFAGVASALLGALGLLSWVFHVLVFPGIGPGLVSMKANTAFCLILCGVVVSTARRESAAQAWLATLFSATVLAVGALSLLEWLSGRSLGIDGLLFRGSTGVTPALARMGPSTAFGLVTMGAGILILSKDHLRRLVRLGRGLVMIPALLGLASLISHLYGAAPTAGIGRYTMQTAPPTAWAFLLLALGTLAARPNDGLARIATSSASAGTLLRRLMPVAVAVPILFGWLSHSGHNLDLYDKNLGFAILTAASVVVFSGFIVWLAQAVHRQDQAISKGIVGTMRQMNDLASRKAQIERLNEVIEAKVRTRTQQLLTSHEQYRALVESTHSIPWQFDVATQAFSYVGPQAAALLLCPVEDWLKPGFTEARMHEGDLARTGPAWFEAIEKGLDVELEFRLRHNDGRWVWLRSIISARPLGTDVSPRGFMFDITERRNLELDLQQAQKLESVGRLASGIAHEINTPIQFVGDSVHFVRDAMKDLAEAMEKLQLVRRAVEQGDPAAAATAAGAAAIAEETTDLPYLLENVPKALDRALEGLERVATIVHSMKEFAHPDQPEMSPADLNRAVQNTLTVATNEYKYVADVQLELQPLPPVTCHVSQINQVILNIVVNGAHAIADRVKDSGERGKITVRTWTEGGDVLVGITDNGNGIPEEVRGKIFDQFFTTKEVGRGTGQGLALARSVVDKHHGQLTFETEVGRGTTFLVRLPLNGEAAKAAQAA
ncbi:MAG: two-component system, NtrC family, sensor kinase [Myxococcales bacterium]|jgi:signal transduction histidine kinase/nitrate reductase NapE component|nr:two-component system, NtrC family, sensor kinase [Myxococcales bacterium]